MIRLVNMSAGPENTWVGTEVEGISYAESMEEIVTFLNEGSLVLLVDSEEDIPEDINYEMVEE